MILPLMQLIPAIVQQSQDGIKNFPTDTEIPEECAAFDPRIYSHSLKQDIAADAKEIQRPKAIDLSSNV